MKKPLLLLLGLVFLGALPARGVFPDHIPVPQIGMAEALRQATAALEPYLKEQQLGNIADFQPLQANYIWRGSEYIGPGAGMVKERGIWLVMFAPSPSAHIKVYVYILRDGQKPLIFTLHH